MGDLFDLLGLQGLQGNPLAQTGLQGLLGHGNLFLDGMTSDAMGNQYRQGPFNAQLYYAGMQQQLANSNPFAWEVNPYEPGSELWEKKEWDIRFCRESKITPDDFYIQLMEIEL